MKRTLIFRGRSTAGIANDAIATGLATPESVVVICREADDMAEPGDIRAKEWTPGPGDVVVANGGTTSQLLDALKRVSETGVTIDLVEIDRGGTVARRLRLDFDRTCACGCGETGSPVATASCARKISW